MDAYNVLVQKYGKDLARATLNSYTAIEENFLLGKWKASELDSGHFVEAVRRILEQELFGSSTPLSSKLANYSDVVIKRYEQATGNESHRLLIPKALKAIYNIRNKRGVGHLNQFSPNEMDATYILYTAKWILAELVRLSSQLSTQETQKLVDRVVERQISLLWKSDGIVRVLDTSLSAREKILILLYDESPRLEEDIRLIIEYKNKANFRTMLKKLHGSRLIEYKNGSCFLSPKGTVEAENLIKSSRYAS